MIIAAEAIEKNAISSECFADRMEMLIRLRGCSKSWLAKELDISKQALHHILKHRKNPKFISEFALIFNVSPKWLETGEGKMGVTAKSHPIKIPLYKLTEHEHVI